LHQDTIEALIEGYNKTPPNFQCPSDEVIEMCIKAVERQMAMDEQASLVEAVPLQQNGPH
jgi:hypothetical protein